MTAESPAAAETQNEAQTTCLTGLTFTEARVVDVIDGDTIKVRLNGAIETVRYLGVDTPELKARDPQPGKTAMKWNREKVGGKTIWLYSGNRDRDDYGRLLRLVMADDVFINSTLIREGLATSFNRPHDAVCAQQFTADMLYAYQNRLGIWQGMDDITGVQTDERCPEGCILPPNGCTIKGNINASDDYIYHLPGSEDYADVRIEADRGERWFCTLEEAIRNGWRPARQE